MRKRKLSSSQNIPRGETRTLDKELEKAKQLENEGHFLESSNLLLGLLRKKNTPIDRMEEILSIFIPVYEKYLNENDTFRCLNCWGWAKKTGNIIKCPMCDAEFPA